MLTRLAKWWLRRKSLIVARLGAMPLEDDDFNVPCDTSRGPLGPKTGYRIVDITPFGSPERTFMRDGKETKWSELPEDERSWFMANALGGTPQSPQSPSRTPGVPPG